MIIKPEFKALIAKRLVENRPTFDGPDSAYAGSFGISGAIYSQVKKGLLEGKLSPQKWITIARKLGIPTNERTWTFVKTEVYYRIEEDLNFCKSYSKAMIFVDEPEIGKTVAAKYFKKNNKGVFYIDASQCKTYTLLIKAIAKEMGFWTKDKKDELISDIKYYITTVENPLIIIDEAGDLQFEAFLFLKELWNATEGCCGFYLMGSDGLRHKITKGISHEKQGYKEIFSRFSGNYSSIVPIGKEQKKEFYKHLVGDVLEHNIKDKAEIPKIIQKVITKEGSGLRRAESLLILHEKPEVIN